MRATRKGSQVCIHYIILAYIVMHYWHDYVHAPIQGRLVVAKCVHDLQLLHSNHSKPLLKTTYNLSKSLC